MKEYSEKKIINIAVLVNTLFFIAGFSIVFILLGASATFIGKIFVSHAQLFSKISGIIIILFGLHVLGVLKLKFLYYQKTVQQKKINIKYMSSLLLGMGFAFGWSPCVGPILAGILLFASQKETIYRGIMLLMVYSAGLAIPFIITALGINYFFVTFNKFKKYLRYAEYVAGIFLILLGILIFFRKLGYIISFMPFLS
jgi:cytochrome c-type biogenesis protein